MVGFWVFAVIALICGTIIFLVYMCLCSDNEVKMFKDNSMYEQRLSKIEKQIKKMTEG